jgi:hypothetical protein
MTRQPKPQARVVAMTALALFCATFALLVFQLRAGRDPALDRGMTPVAASAPAVRHVVVRKVIVTRVIVHLPSDDGGASRSVSVPVVTTAPASSTAAVAPAVPAPAPAPLTTRTS